ncbi:serine/threonine protein kinase [Amycolatopsis sp. NPDC058986]|uniref:serine/threonine protein kinase n=1 Tax=unclassified Amycolatopsis TaxID=2618356 RepID=UPI00366D7C19
MMIEQRSGFRSSFRRRRSGGTTSPGAWSAPIGIGPVATVYSGHSDGVPVAFKVFPDRIDRRTLTTLEDEQTKLADLVGTYAILPVQDLDQVADGRHALRMELCQESLADVVARTGALAPGDVLVFGHAIAAALAAAHAVGVVHGGVKPSNVLIRMSGQPVLADFGVALRRAFPRDVERLLDGLAPETLRTDTFDERSDLYGLGALLHTALTGEPPLPSRLGERLGDRMLRLLRTRVPRIDRPGVPDQLSEVVAQLLLPEPERRPPGAAWVAEQLADLLPGTSLSPVVFPPAEWPSTEDASWQAKPAPRRSFVDTMPPVADAETFPPPMSVPEARPVPADSLPPGSVVSGVTPAPPEATPSGARRILSFAGVGVACVAVGALAVWLSLGGVPGSSPTSPSPTPSSAPASPPASAADEVVVLDPPLDRGADVVLSWRTSRLMDYGVVVAPEGEHNHVVLAQRNRSITVPVDPKRRYCFQIQATEGGAVYTSNAVAVRGAVCR